MMNDYLAALRDKLAAGDATEHTHRAALERLVQSFDKTLQISNEPKRIKVGQPDLVVRKRIARDQLLPVGYIETKDIGDDLGKTEKSEQLQRYLQLPNLILTDYLEFRWYVKGERRQAVRLAERSGKKIKLLTDGAAALAGLLESFLAQDVRDINTPKELAARMAGLCKNIDRVITQTFAAGEASALMLDLKSAFERTLLPDITDAQFADMFAQTLGYGLFAARIQHAQTPPNPPASGGASKSPPVHGGTEGGSVLGTEGGLHSAFTRTGAAREIPKSNPFLRDLFYTIHSPQLEDEPFIGFVDDLTAVLAHTDIGAVLAQFGKRTKQEDPILHFYETFLSEYDPKERKRRGVYYTPEPVVSYIVRSVDILLKEKFGLQDGLADTSTIEVEVKEGDQFVTKTLPKVLILDPACGTGTFLYAVVDLIRNRFMEQNRAGEWQAFVREQLLPRIYGFELQMAPYAVAHLKLAMQLAGHDLESDALRKKWGYEFDKDERLNIYLTNSLEETEYKAEEFFGTMKIITQEANAAADIKNRLPILVILGNPPYAGHSANRSEYIAEIPTKNGKVKKEKRFTLVGGLLRDYYVVDGEPLGEKNPKWLQDDYVKFLRYGQWRIAQKESSYREQLPHGILAMITNHSYLDNPTFRGMRRSLQTTFDEIHLLDLHGNSKKKEQTPDGGKDENVFDIQQGVAVALFVKTPGKRDAAAVRRADLWGQRGQKYAWLAAHNHTDTTWQELEPEKPFYLFTSSESEDRDEYSGGYSVQQIFGTNSVGVVTARDELVVHWNANDAFLTAKSFAEMEEEEARETFELGPDVRDWRVRWAQRDVLESGVQPEFVTPLLYRPFDIRHAYYTGSSRGFMCYPRTEVMRHMLAGENLAMITVRRIPVSAEPRYFMATRSIISNGAIRSDNQSIDTLFPLYLYPADGSPRRPNLDPQFAAEFAAKLGLTYVEEGSFWTPSPNPFPVNEEGAQSPSVYGGDRGGLTSPQAVSGGLDWDNIPKTHWQFAREMRKAASAAETKLWKALKSNQLEATFRRQHPIGPFIADFYCAERQLVIDVDGATHIADDAKKYDIARDGQLRSLGLTVLRFTNDAVLKDLDGVIASIAKCLRTPPNPPASRGAPQSPPVYGGTEIGPEDIFYYIYAIFHSPTYRERYKEFLKIDFPRVPLTSDVKLFAKLVTLGYELVQYHLLEHPNLHDTPIRFPEPGDNLCEKIRYDEQHGRVYINKTQYFETIPPDVWEFHVGGYQVCEKWLKDRAKAKRTLTLDDLKHYEKTAMALAETMRLMKEIDAAIPAWPLT